MPKWEDVEQLIDQAQVASPHVENTYLMTREHLDKIIKAVEDKCFQAGFNRGLQEGKPVAPEDLKEAVEIISAGDNESDDPKLEVTSKVLKESLCDDGKEHRVFIGMTGDTWPAFCCKCRRYARESDAFPYEGDLDDL